MRVPTVLFTLAVLGLWGCDSEAALPSQRPVLVKPVASAEPEVSRVFPGRISARGEVALSFEVAGRLQELLVKPGDRVEAGQELARMDAEPFAIAVAQAESSVAGAQAAAAEAAAALARAQELFARETLAKASLDAAVAANDGAQAALRGAEAGLRRAERNLRDAVLRAPFDALIAERLAEEGAQLSPASPVFVIQSYETVRVTIQVPERYVLSLQGSRGERREERPQALVTFLGHEDEIFTAEFEEVATTPDALTLSWALRFTLPLPESVTVLPGMSCMVRLSGVGQALAEPGLRLPVSSLVSAADGSPAVWVIDGNLDAVGRARRVPVQVGPLNEGVVAVQGELAPGDLVVRAGARFLTEGMRVRAVADLGLAER
ncbi:MAG: efflux RND transporter periplasmic adaptor subunit [Planctomycetota bacterium]|nr:MAG: efflux RND transporter periplasmic adaptor subunit [Planctomycetota bacterium]